MPQFDIAVFSSQIFWLVIMFSILMIYTVTISVPRMRNLLDERWQRTDGYKLSAERFLSESEDIDQKREELIKKARQNAQELVTREAQKIQEKFSSERNGIHKVFKARLEEAEEKAKAEFQAQMKTIDNQTIEATIAIIDRIMGIKPDDVEVTKYMNDSHKQAVIK